MMRIPSHFLLAVALGAGGEFRDGFEDGIGAWNTVNDRYAEPKGGGTSAIAVVAEGRGGGKALRIDGGGKRGIALRALPAYPGKYRVAGWIRAEGIDAGRAGILVEWIDGKGKWMRGDRADYFEKWRDRFEEVRRKGSEIWFYVAWVPQGKFPNRMIDSWAGKPRVLHWLNALHGTSGYLHWALNW
jgi:hypothetical protein